MIKADLGLSAEEIETALASNNRNLARIHVALLKVVYLTVPPVRVGSHMFASDSRVCIIWYPPVRACGCAGLHFYLQIRCLHFAFK